MRKWLERIPEDEEMYVQTITGRNIYPAAPGVNKEHISIVDIAHALSRINRFAGHTSIQYSVAQHCIFCVECAMDTYDDIELARYMLLHDAHEAYIGDIATPFKNALPGVATLEAAWIHTICDRFDIDYNSVDANRAKSIDTFALYVEANALLPEQDWADEVCLEGIDLPLLGQTPNSIKLRYLELFDLLEAKRKGNSL